MSQSTGTRREQIKAETRRIILNAAYELFEEKGFEKATMRELAARAGVGLGTIFQHFDDKASLLLAAFDDDLGRISREAIADMPDADLKTRMLFVFRRVLSFYGRNPPLARILVKEALFVQGETERRMRAQETEVFQLAGRILEEAAASGELRPDQDLGKIFFAIWSFYLTSVIYELRQPDFNPDRILKGLGDLFDQLMRGIGA